ncbi:MAG: DNA translocase FtsK 4TM domain-containing protein, partial [Sandaracinaceae bacterium]|nr:DNA translocase FtsK 4TM domain-containing protein [Sandaracinaceae bacterium]
MATADRTLDDESELPRPKARARKKAEEPSTPAKSERPRAVPIEEEGRRHEVLGLFALAGTILTGLALFSYDAREVDNAIGFLGQSIASVLATAFGVAAWFVPLELALLTGRLFRRSRSPLGLARLASTVVVVLIGCAMVHLAMPDEEVMGGHLPGGLLGEVLGELMRSLFGLVGAFVVGLTVLLVTLVLRTSLSVVGVSKQVAGAARKGGEKAKEGIGQVASALREARELELREREEERLKNQPRIIVGASSAGTVPALDKGKGERADKLDRAAELGAAELEADALPKARAKKKGTPVVEPALDEDEHDALTDTDPDGEHDAHDELDEPALDDDDVVATPTEVSGLRKSAKVEDAGKASPDANRASPGVSKASPGVSKAWPDASKASPDASKASPDANKAWSDPNKGSDAAAKASVAKGPTIVPPIVGAPKDAPSPPASPASAAKKSADDFVLPPPSLLDAPPSQALQIDEAQLRLNAERLVDKLGAYGVKGRIDEIHPGPVVTMYELEPESGTKLSKIASLSDDLAMALAAQKVRIVAPIPGKARVGFELPNKHRQMVALREILEDPRWHESKAALPVAFGKDIAGQPVYGDLAKMPHLLVAGATGAGKSVGLNVMLASLLMKRTPDDVRLLMIDPKVVELAVFDGIPHMLLPVVTDMKKASLALRWAVDEMERRYQLFADAGARNITTYNERVDKVLRGELSPEKLHPKKVGKQLALGLDGEEVLVDPVDGERPDALPMPTRLPYVVVVVDEFADLMMVAAKDVEAAIARLAQKARAAGIHVILATQRPSVDVITGMIKANFPARIAFKVSQREDSKTILGRIGAEHLLGAGDMLMIPPGASDLKRVHSAFISEDEVQAVCDHLRAQGAPVYDERITAPREDEEGEPGAEGASEGGGSGDALYDKAVAAV